MHFMMVIMIDHREDGNNAKESWFLSWFIPPQSICISTSWNSVLFNFWVNLCGLPSGWIETFIFQVMHHRNKRWALFLLKQQQLNNQQDNLAWWKWGIIQTKTTCQKSTSRSQVLFQKPIEHVLNWYGLIDDGLHCAHNWKLWIMKITSKRSQSCMRLVLMTLEYKHHAVDHKLSSAPSALWICWMLCSYKLEINK